MPRRMARYKSEPVSFFAFAFLFCAFFKMRVSRSAVCAKKAPQCRFRHMVPFSSEIHGGKSKPRAVLSLFALFFLWQWMLCMQTNLSRKSDSARLWQITPKNPPCAQSFWYTERYCAACLSCQAAHCAVTKKKRRGKGERAQNRFGRCSAAEACEACANRVGSGVQKQSFRTESV